MKDSRRGAKARRVETPVTESTPTGVSVTHAANKSSRSSVGQSARLISVRSQVQSLPGQSRCNVEGHALGCCVDSEVGNTTVAQLTAKSFMSASATAGPIPAKYKLEEKEPVSSPATANKPEASRFDAETD